MFPQVLKAGLEIHLSARLKPCPFKSGRRGREPFDCAQGRL